MSENDQELRAYRQVQGEHSLLATTFGVFGAAVTDRATATQTCQGSYTAALLQPLPAKIVATIDIHDRSPRNLTLAERFLGGVRDAGVAVGAQPNGQM